MRQLRFHHVFSLLMALAVVTAFIIPGKYTDRAAPQLQILFGPVSRPVRAIASAVVDRVTPAQGNDLGTPRQVRDELALLRQDNIKLRYDLEESARKNGEREKLGAIGDLCTPVAVLGGDAGPHETLAVQGSSLQGLKDGMFVLYAGGIVGTLQRAGVAGSQVQLVTDPNANPIEGYFEKPRRAGAKAASEKKTKTPPRYLIRGAGDGKMVCSFVKRVDKEQMGLEPGDLVVADDRSLPAALRGRVIGQIAKIVPDRQLPLEFVQVSITPTSDLLKLREVMVLSKEK